MMRTLTLGLLTVFLLGAARADDAIRLPSGTVFKIASFAVQPKWTEWFPADHAFYAEKYGEGSLKGMHARYSGRLDGASVVLHENGNVKMLAYYPDGQRQGSCRVWDEDRRMVFYCKFKDNEKDGMTCLFKDGTPWLVQEWDKNALQNETVLVRKGSDYVAIDDAQQLAHAQERLSTVEKELAETDRDIKTSLRKWFTDEGDRIKKEKEKALTKVAAAKSEADRQRIRLEKDARIAALHTRRDGTLDRVGHEARADEKLAAQDLKAAQKHLEAVTKEAKRAVAQIEKETAEHCKQLYQFAMAALEKRPLEDVPAPKKPRHRKRL
jgi:hypothetical protein